MVIKLARRRRRKKKGSKGISFNIGGTVMGAGMAYTIAPSTTEALFTANLANVGSAVRSDAQSLNAEKVMKAAVLGIGYSIAKSVMGTKRIVKLGRFTLNAV